MNLDDLTIGQLKKLQSICSSAKDEPTKRAGINCMVGLFVVVRTYAAGVHVGILAEKDGNEVILRDARRLWSWSGANTLHEVSQAGVAATSKISQPVPRLWLEAIEILPCSDKAKEQLSSSKWG